MTVLGAAAIEDMFVDWSGSKPSDKKAKAMNEGRWGRSNS